MLLASGPELMLILIKHCTCRLTEDSGLSCFRVVRLELVPHFGAGLTKKKSKLSDIESRNGILFISSRIPGSFWFQIIVGWPCVFVKPKIVFIRKVR